ncbi:hypothetical protein V5D56_19570 [Cellulosimicrobium sp. PMB13]
MSRRPAAEDRRRELRWIVGTVVVLLVTAAVVPIALPFLSAVAADLF